MKKNAVKLMFFFLFLPNVTLACSVPVFRYALERWVPDAYEVIVFHRGALESSDKEIVDFLKDSASRYNLEVRAVDLAGEPEQSMQKLWEEQSAKELPWMVLRYPRIWRRKENIWSGGLSAEIVRKMADSPIRREIARRILDGDCSVWILLESGDAEKDNAAAGRLQNALDKMQQSLKLPALAVAAAAEIGPKLRVSFSMVRLSRTNPAEQIFVNMLLRTNPNPKEPPEPVAFSTFGRGRVLYAIAGEDINEKNIETGSSFLMGECSCTIKAENPGGDLLMAINWDGLITGELVVEEELPELKGLSQFVEATGPDDRGTADKTAASGADLPVTNEETLPVSISQSAGARGSVLVRNILIVLAVGIVLVIVATLRLKKG